MTNISYNYHLFFLSIFLVHTIKSQQNQVYLATADKKIIVTQKNDLHVSKLLQTLLQDCNPTIAPCIPVNQHPFYTKKYLTKMLYDMHKYKPMVRSDKKITKKLLFSGYLKKLDYLDATKNERTDFIHDFKLLVTCISLQLEQKHRTSSKHDKRSVI